MSFVNFETKEITYKIVYYGPGLAGKTSNVRYIYEKTNPAARGKMLSLETETERTLFFDFLPLSLGELPGGFKTRFHLYTVPGQVFYRASRELILRGMDGVIFVADSQLARMEANLESLDELRDLLAEQGKSFPLVLQYNKRDLPTRVELSELRQLMNPTNVPEVEAEASRGVGVFETLKIIAKQVFQRTTVRR